VQYNEELEKSLCSILCEIGSCEIATKTIKDHYKEIRLLKFFSVTAPKSFYKLSLVDQCVHCTSSQCTSSQLVWFTSLKHNIIIVRVPVNPLRKYACIMYGPQSNISQQAVLYPSFNTLLTNMYIVYTLHAGAIYHDTVRSF